jgi:adenylyltransferase/sulfurtransferase
MVSVEQTDLHEDRFSRLRLIPWWDQSKIANFSLLVVGAGALGNEILKNAALLGFRKVVIVDLDQVEESNLSRTVLYKEEDIGLFKADAAARAYQEMAKDARVHPLVSNVVHGCGLGLFQWADVILAGLDNREARLWINRCAWKTNRPWIDGAIEGINGVARVFLPGVPPCYECTLGEVDWALLEKRMSCNLLAHEEATEGKIPTTPTISSVIEYTENPDCMSHYTLPDVVRLAERSRDLTLRQLWQRAQSDLGAQDVTVEFSRDVIQKLVCPACGEEEQKFAPAGTVKFEAAKCPKDGHLRSVSAIHSYTGSEDFGNRQLDQLGLPLLDLFTARSCDREIGYIPYGDAPAVLGPLATEETPA